MHPEQSLNKPKVSNTRKRKIILFLGTAAVAVTVGFFYYFNILGFYAAYIYVFKTDRFAPYSVVYLSDAIVNKGTGDGILVMRLIRPIRENEIENKLLYTEEDKITALRIAEDNSFKPYLKNTSTFYNIKDMETNKHFTLGRYLDTKILPVNYSSSETHMATYYVTKPDNKYLKYDVMPNLPVGYVYADSLVYIDPFFASPNSPVIHK